MTLTDSPSPAQTPEFKLDPAGRRVFIGLMLGMFVAAISQTIVGPAMPRIVAELGGMNHYSWIATAAMLVSAITVPIVGKMSDLYGRRPFYLAGLVIFMLGSLVCGLSQSFWMLVAGRAIQGFGMGALLPLSQTIIGDIIPPRQRGKYQGVMGSVFGVTSIAGPLAGGFITDHWGWRWLFFVSLPFGLVATVAIMQFLHLKHQRRDAKVDVFGIAFLTIALICILLATSFGGTTYPWSSWQIITMYAVGTVAAIIFVIVETRVSEPVLPLRLFRSSVIGLSVLASFGVAIMMFGAIMYIPIYAQGVIGVNATNSGLILMPLMVGMISLGIVGGFLVTKFGRYKEITLTGVAVMGIGYWMLTRMHYGTTQLELTLAMVVMGLGLGLCMQQFTLIVQNAAHRKDLGVATASVQFFRNVGSTVGIAVFGTVMSSTMPGAIASHLPPQAAAQMTRGGAKVDAGAVLDPHVLAQLPPVVANAVRQGLADSLHAAFMVGVPVAIAVLAITLLIKQIPLRDTVQNSEEAGREMLDTMTQSAPGDELVPALGRDTSASRTRERILGMQLRLLVDEVYLDRPLLHRAISDLGHGDFERGLALLERTATMLASEDHQTIADAEPYAAAVAKAGQRKGGVLSEGLRKELATIAAEAERDYVLHTKEPPVTDRYDGIDIQTLQSVGNDLTAAFLADLHPSESDHQARRSA